MVETGEKYESYIEKQVRRAIEDFQNNEDMLIQILLRLQSNLGWLPREAITEMSKQLDLPFFRVYKIAKFYQNFDLEPKGKHTIRVCMGTSCKARGASSVLEELERFLNIKPGETTPDFEYSLETVYCLGCCAIGPMILVDDDYHVHLSSSKVKEVLKAYE